ncbi:MAG: FISUMP domain-containing protein [Bacteroidales bacterium]|nr:FISUMP domain-containing protein [Bacteroidales bacterium]
MLFVFFAVIYSPVFSQSLGINTTGTPPNPKAILDIDADGITKGGLLIPRMTTTERNTIEAPIPESLLIYNTTTQCFEAWNGDAWVAFGCIACELPGTFTATAATNITATSFDANWTASAGASTYYLDVNTNISFTGTAILNNHDVGNVTSFTVSGLSLSCGTSYYYRLRASNDCGSGVSSNIITLITNECPSSTCGTQIFATANLNAGTMINSTSSGGSQQLSPYAYKYCYGNIPANCDTYGGLYEWNNVMLGSSSVNCDPCGNSGVQGMCPAGYHIPTDLEWSRYEYCLESSITPTGSTTLTTFQTSATLWRGTDSNAGPGAKMKATSLTWDGTNASGFNALPTGYRYYQDGSFMEQNTQTFFWSATTYDGSNAWYHELKTASGQSIRNKFDKADGFSVRCIMN